jgi:hypothetical protein
MSDLITRKPTPVMVELLRRGAADPRGIMTLSDHNDRTQDGILRRDMAEVVAEPGATHSWLVINDRGRAYLAQLDGAQQEPVSAPETAEERPVAPVAPQRPAAPKGPALADIARVHEGTVTLGTGPAALAHPSYVVMAYGSSRHFADVGGRWVAVCGRCGGEGEMPYKHVHGGVCYGCNRTGLRPDIFDGTREERDAFVYRWALKKNRERQAAEKRAAKAHAKRVAAWERWEAANAELVAWCRSLTPDSIEEYDETRQALADTREEAEHLYGEDETLLRSGQYEDGAQQGRWWADFHVVYRSEVFNSYGHRAASLIKDVREGDEPLDARSTALLTKIMRSAVEAQSTTRYAGPVGTEVTVTGRVKRVKIVDGFNAWSPKSRMIVLEGTGNDTGITVTAYSGSAAAKSLEEGQEDVTVAGVVSRHREYSGARETALTRPRITV